ncbi:hypothetical protein [Oricola sp.]|nr:hypothetical protein [Oricola sp.]MCI5078718.1 hypothetical protein [Oricola sp.]
MAQMLIRGMLVLMFSSIVAVGTAVHLAKANVNYMVDTYVAVDLTAHG